MAMFAASRALGLLALVVFGLGWVACPMARGATDGVEVAVTIYSTIDTEGLLEIMKEEGYAASSSEKDVVIWKHDGYKSNVFISGRNGSNLQFHISFGDGNATLKKINEWNRTKRYSRTYLDDEGDPHLELDLDLEGGVTRARIVDFLSTCRVSMGAWCNEVVR